MNFNKVLSNSRHLFSGKTSNVKTVGEAVRNYYAAVPARTPMSTGEKVVIGSVLTIAMYATPFWILYHIPDYQNENRNEYTGK